MSVCEVCGNDYDKAFRVVDATGNDHVFDSFECAITSLAPVCAHCGCRIVGHGTEANGRMFCCAHCAHQEGVQAVQDRA
jgi:hypothetical protein